MFQNLEMYLASSSGLSRVKMLPTTGGGLTADTGLLPATGIGNVGLFGWNA